VPLRRTCKENPHGFGAEFAGQLGFRSITVRSQFGESEIRKPGQKDSRL
jgi:hypothetical protein